MDLGCVDSLPSDCVRFADNILEGDSLWFISKDSRGLFGVEELVVLTRKVIGSRVHLYTSRGVHNFPSSSTHMILNDSMGLPAGVLFLDKFSASIHLHYEMSKACSSLSIELRELGHRLNRLRLSMDKHKNF